MEGSSKISRVSAFSYTTKAQKTLLEEIERARQKIHALAPAGSGRENILGASRELDRLIAGFYKENPEGR